MNPIQFPPLRPHGTDCRTEDTSVPNQPAYLFHSLSPIDTCYKHHSGTKKRTFSDYAQGEPLRGQDEK